MAVGAWAGCAVRPRAPVGGPVAFPFCLVGTGNFLRALSLHPRQQVGRVAALCAGQQIDPFGQV